MRKVQVAIGFIILVLGPLGRSNAFGAQIIDSQGSWKLNWSTGRFEYIGAAAELQRDKSYKEVEGSIWKSARDDIAITLPSIRELYEGPGETGAKWSKIAVARVQKNLVSKKTVYLPDGAVAVKLLAEAGDFFYAEGQSETDSPLAPATGCSGVVFRLATAEKPMPYYKIVDKTGNILLSLDNISKAAYAKNLMGRWFRSPSASEVQEVAGGKSMEFQAVVAARGVLRIDSPEEAKNLAACRDALAQSRIVLAIP